jgi:UDP-N-acetylglucosamine 2-epimerase
MNELEYIGSIAVDMIQKEREIADKRLKYEGAILEKQDTDLLPEIHRLEKLLDYKYRLLRQEVVNYLLHNKLS